MATANPFHIIVTVRPRWDDGSKNDPVEIRERNTGVLGNPVYAHFTVRCNGIDNGEIHVALGDPMQQMMREDSAAVSVFYRGQFLTSGRLRTVTGDVQPTGVAVFQMRGDYSALQSSIGWVRPFGGSEYQYWESAPTGHYHWDAATRYTETAVRELIQKNVGGGSGVALAGGDGLRGGDIRAAGLLPMVRFQPIDELVNPMLEWGNLRLIVGRYQELDELDDTTGITATIQPRGVWGPKLSVEAGTVVEGSWTTTTSSISEVIVGGPGEDADRIFLIYQNETREDQEGWRNTVFKDATNVKLDWGPDTFEENKRGPLFFGMYSVPQANKDAVRRQFDEVARKAFEEGAASSSISVTLSESPGFHFGGANGIQLGDEVTIDVAGVPFKNRLTECSLTLTDKDFTVTPSVGEPVVDQDRELAKSIAKVADSQRRIMSGR